MIPASCGGKTWPPLDQYALTPLSDGGLCEAEIMTPTSHFRCRIANDNSGVDRYDSKRETCSPRAAKTQAARRENSRDRSRVSYATTAWPPRLPPTSSTYTPF